MTGQGKWARWAPMLVALLGGGAMAGLTACSGSATSPADATALTAISPVGGATGVSTGDSVVLRFSRPVGMGMESYVALHQGEMGSPVVPCGKTWSADSLALTLMPDAPLMAGTHYTIHVGGGMLDGSGHPIDMTSYGMDMGGRCAPGGMMGGTCQDGMTFDFTTR